MTEKQKLLVNSLMILKSREISEAKQLKILREAIKELEKEIAEMIGEIKE